MSKLLNSPTEEVVAVVNRDGLDRVAARHRISRHKLYRWLREQGYISKQLYVPRDPKPQHEPFIGSQMPDAEGS